MHWWKAVYSFNSSICVPLFFNSHLSQFLSAWAHITSDQWVLSTVELGYALQFISTSPFHPPSLGLFRDHSHKIILQQKIQSLLQAGATVEVLLGLRGKSFCYRYFLIHKANGSLKCILELRALNKLLKKIKFCMVTLASIIFLLEHRDGYTALDLKDTYFHFTI